MANPVETDATGFPTRRARRGRAFGPSVAGSVPRFAWFWASRRSLIAAWMAGGAAVAATLAIALAYTPSPASVGWLAVVAAVAAAAFAVLGFAVAAFAISLRAHHRWSVIGDYAAAHGARFRTAVRTSSESEILALRGVGGLSTYELRLETGVRIGEWEYVREWSDPPRLLTAHVWTYIEVPLPAPVPHLLLDSTRNRRALTLDAAADFDRAQVLSLEGDFDRYFTTYFPDGYGADARYFLTPDVMLELIETAADWDVEFVDASMVFFRPGRAGANELPDLVAFAGRWTARARRWGYWRDHRTNPDAPIGRRVPVHPDGRRLESGRLVAIGMFVVLGLVVLAMPIVGALTA